MSATHADMDQNPDFMFDRCPQWKKESPNTRASDGDLPE
jgi:hypothetical protein